MDNMTIITAAELAAARRVGIKREIMGTDFRNHGGARGIIHADRKQKAARAKWDKRKADWN